MESEHISHELNEEWTYYVHGNGSNYGEGVLSIGEFNTIEDFWRYFNNINLEGGIRIRDKYFNGISLFRSTMKPTWEDPKNINGSKLILKGNNLSYEDMWLIWKDICMYIVGETIEANGARIVCRQMARGYLYKIEVWFEGDTVNLPTDMHLVDQLDTQIFKHSNYSSGS